MTTGNERIHESSTNNGNRVVHFTTFKTWQSWAQYSHIKKNI